MWHTKEHVGDPEEKMSKPRHLAEVLCTRAFLEAGSPGQRNTLSQRERTAAFMFFETGAETGFVPEGQRGRAAFFSLEAGSAP